MNRILTYFRDRHETIFKAFLFISFIALIVYLFPREAQFKYELKNLGGKAWSNEDLIAPFDFSILKPADKIKAEKEDIIRNSLAVFRKDEKIALSKINRFSLTEVPEDLSLERKDELESLGRSLLDSIYSKGIISINDSIGKILERDPEKKILLLVNNPLASEVRISEFYTIKTAFEYAEGRIPNALAEKEMLLSGIENHLDINIIYDEPTSRKLLEDVLKGVPQTDGGIMKGQIIISRGDLVTLEKIQILESLKTEYEGQSGKGSGILFILTGQTLAVTLLIVLLAAFIILFRADIYQNTNKIFFILLMMLLMVLMTSLTLKYNLLHYYLLPYCILPVIMRTFYDTRLALFVHLLTVLIISFMLPAPFEFIFIQLTAGIAAIFSIVSMRRRSQIFISSAIIFGTYLIAFFAMSLVQDTGLQSIKTDHVMSFLISSSVTLFSYPLIYVFERSFGFVSDVTLLEISDTNSPLLRELASKAPGTFQHSLQVSDIAEEIVREIGGNTLLARTGALYHDIGKMEMPMFFVENQVTGMNPHEDLEFEESARIIISHVIRGIERAKKQGIPDLVTDFIRTHHGTTTTGFFYRSYKLSHPEGTATEGDFQYPGPLPYSKETAAVMLADSVEASARALKKHDADTLGAHVDAIVNALIAQNQFVNADITFRDVTIVKKILKKKLANMYHHRIEYPR